MKHSLVGLAVFCAFNAHAAIGDPLIQNAKYCTDQFSVQERRYNVPKNLIAAIANTESGRWNDTLGMVLPWPWTINAEGKGYYFKSKAEAVRKVKALQATGMKSIDIGCMQVNLKHHPNAFSSIEQAFDPRHNVAYAAKFLNGHYEEMHNWNKAIAAYHSKTPKYGNKYLARVKKSWDAIEGKVRVARTALGETKESRRNSPSYRLVKVYDKGERQVASLRPERQPIALSVKDRNDGRDTQAKAIALRPQDRLSGRSVKRISVSNAESQSERSGVMTIHVNDGESRQSSPRLAASAASGGSSFVSHFGENRSKDNSSGAKPKFIFVK